MRKAIITGASEGLGFQISQVLIEHEWEVVGISRHKGSDDRVGFIQGDLTKEDEIKRVVEEIKKQHSKFDLLINCAGVLLIEKLGEIDYKKTEELIRLNLIAPIMIVSNLKDLILQNEADILNVGSTSGYKGRENWAAYGSSKWGLRGLHENLKLEFKETKTRVVLFNPPAFKSNHFQKAGIEADMSEFLDPRDVANLLYSLIVIPKNVQVGEIIINKK
jgi:short-subunit dehydrogenase